MEEERNYEIVTKSAISILQAFSVVGIIILVLIILLNRLYILPKTWNISFIIPIVITFFASITQLIICFWKVGKTNIHTKKYNLIFSSCITFLVLIGEFIMYSMLSIILF